MNGTRGTTESEMKTRRSPAALLYVLFLVDLALVLNVARIALG